MRAPRSSFTLVELLVALAALSFVVLIVAQLLGAAMRAVDFSSRRMDAVTQANQAFDRLDADLRRALWRPDLLPSATVRNGSDEIRFYSSVPAYAGTRNVSVVAYRIGLENGMPVLERGVAGTSWLASDAPGVLSFSTNQDASAMPISAADFQPLAPAVFRMELAFVDRATGKFKDKPASPDWSDTAGMVVTLAAIDPRSRQPLGPHQPAVIQAFADKLPDFAGGTPVFAAWKDAATPAVLQVAGLPPQVQGQLRVLQRLYAW